MLDGEAMPGNIDVSAASNDHDLSNIDNNGPALTHSQSDNDKDEEDEGIPADDEGLQEIRGERVMDSQQQTSHFFIGEVVAGDAGSSSDSEGGDDAVTVAAGKEAAPPPNLFQLPEVAGPAERRRRSDPLIDYSKSIIMTSEDYLRAMEDKARLKEDTQKAREQKRLEADCMKQQRAEEKKLKEVSKRKRQDEAAARRAFKE